ncbi:hypothetical protein BC629DRAFT_1442993 [Irpex lacteus]|nr:hypothetical protein BC629DRAFT_1442993 [Irpex lacteus]
MANGGIQYASQTFGTGILSSVALYVYTVMHHLPRRAICMADRGTGKRRRRLVPASSAEACDTHGKWRYPRYKQASQTSGTGMLSFVTRYRYGSTVMHHLPRRAIRMANGGIQYASQTFGTGMLQFVALYVSTVMHHLPRRAIRMADRGIQYASYTLDTS